MKAKLLKHLKQELLKAANESDQCTCDVLAELVDDMLLGEDCKSRLHVDGVHFGERLNDLAMKRVVKNENG